MNRFTRPQLALAFAAAVLLAAACLGKSPADAAMDKLDLAVGAVERAVADYRQAARDAADKARLAAKRKAVAQAGNAMQEAYAPVRDLDPAKLETGQEARRSSLQERAVNAAADLIDITIGDPAKRPAAE